MGEFIQLTASDGQKFDAYLAQPGGKPRGGVVVLQEIFGINAHIQNVADGYAADGYLAIAPALFDRIEPKIELGYEADDIERGIDLKGRSATGPAWLDIAAARDTVAAAGKVVAAHANVHQASAEAAGRMPKEQLAAKHT